MARSFEDRPAERERVPLLIGLVGASSSGKTVSALRLATGMIESKGGEIFVIDTEHKRALHYASDFRFRHIPFEAPFSPNDYLAAFRHCEAKGAGVVIVDSLSHEHTGVGGVLEWHDQELDRLAGSDFKQRQKMTFTAWIKPKQARRKLIDYMVQSGLDILWCFRAVEKLKIQRGKDPIPLGWMPSAGEEFVYEATLQCLLYPASGGVPTWKTEEPGEKMITKLPMQFVDYFTKHPGPLDEATGKYLADWARGSGAAAPRATPAREEAPSETKEWLDEIQSLVVRSGMNKKRDRLQRHFEEAFGSISWASISKLPPERLADGLEKLKECFARAEK